MNFLISLAALGKEYLLQVNGLKSSVSIGYLDPAPGPDLVWFDTCVGSSRGVSAGTFGHVRLLPSFFDGDGELSRVRLVFGGGGKRTFLGVGSLSGVETFEAGLLGLSGGLQKASSIELTVLLWDCGSVERLSSPDLCSLLSGVQGGLRF